MLFFTICGCAAIPVSDEKLDKLGADVHDKIIEQYGEYEDPKLQEYIEMIGNNVGAASGYTRTPLKFTILDTPMVNAFSVPGGYIFVTRGLLARANSEAELAMVLGHETGHLTARHSAQRISQIMSAGMFSTFFSIFISVYADDPRLGSLVGDIIDFGSIIAILNYGREAEFEADRLGIEYASGANYDPHAAMKFLNVLKSLEEASNRERYPLFETHPPSEERIKKADVVATGCRKGISPEAFFIGDTDYKKSLDGMVIGESLESGFIKDDVYYNKNYKFMLHKLKGWKLTKSRSYRVALVYGQDNAFLVYAEIPYGATNLYDYSIDFLKRKLDDEKFLPKLVPGEFRGLKAYEYFTRKSKDLIFLFFQKEGIYYTLVYSYKPSAFVNYGNIWKSLIASFSFMSKETHDTIFEDKMELYTVGFKDTPMSLGKKFYNDVSLGEELLKYNGIEMLTPGEILKIPSLKYLLEKETGD